MRRPGPYQVQAAIAAVHGDALRSGETDWPQIVGLYDELLPLEPSPIVELNQAVAVSMAFGPDRSLPLLEALAEADAPPGYDFLPAARADALRRLGRFTEAAAMYREALALAANPAERAFLARRIQEVGGSVDVARA